MKKIYLFSTVGISILRNHWPKNCHVKLSDIANLVEEEMDTSALSLVQSAVDSARKELENASKSKLKKLSAELNGILSYQDEFDTSPIINNVLVITDTYIGRQSAKLLSEWLINYGKMATESWPIADLRTAQRTEFRSALSGVVPELINRIEGADSDGWHVVFNLTGGFKGVNGFLQTTAMLWANETIYVFEGNKELLHIPRMPIAVDTSQIKGDQFELFRKMAAGSAVLTDAAKKASIADSLLFEVDGIVTLSEWGELIWEKVYREEASANLLAAPHANIIYSDSFKRDAKTLPANRMRLINKALLTHANYIDGKPEGRLKSNKFKQLAGNPVPPSTHERYVWSDQNAKRLFMHMDDGKWIIDSLGDHL